jgi:hypothetical protein
LAKKSSNSKHEWKNACENFGIHVWKMNTSVQKQNILRALNNYFIHLFISFFFA